MLYKFFQHFSNYSLGKLLVLVAGIISFPLLTRLLPVDQYGMMSLVSTTITFLVAFGKLGLQHSAMRFYADTLEANADYSFPQYASTTFFGMTLLASIVSIIWFLFNFFIPESFWGDPALKYLFMITSGLVFIRVVTSVFINILGAQEKSGFVSIYQVAYRYAILILVVLVLLFISKSVVGVFLAQFVVDFCSLALLMLILYKTFEIRWANRSWPLFTSMMMFGLPMFGFELAGTALNVGDRYVIQWMLDVESLGVYAANYNLCEYAKNVVTSAVGMSVLPMYLRINAEQGESAAHDFIVRSLHLYGLLAMPVVAGISATGAELVSLLASDRYVDGASVIPYVMLGMVVYGAMVMIVPGLYIKKQSLLLMGLVAGTAVLNIVLNVILIPHYGVKGAGMATLMSFMVFGVASYFFGKKHFYVKLPIMKLLQAVGAALLMYFVMRSIETEKMWLTVLVQSVVGGLVYVVTILVVDSEARRFSALLVNKVKAGLGK